MLLKLLCTITVLPLFSDVSSLGDASLIYVLFIYPVFFGNRHFRLTCHKEVELQVQFNRGKHSAQACKDVESCGPVCLLYLV